VLVRVRVYVEGGRQLFTAVAERADPGTWAWYGAIDPDEVARNLERNSSYPVDLDATRDDKGLRFSVVMYRGQPRLSARPAPRAEIHSRVQRPGGRRAPRCRSSGPTRRRRRCCAISYGAAGCASSTRSACAGRWARSRAPPTTAPPRPGLPKTSPACSAPRSA